jgi:APA family basic amino acid/polyamine antiporter
MKLKRELGLFSTTLYGIGVILGAGIYALIGVGAGIAGNMLWFAFLLSATIAVFTGLSYAELSGMFPKEAAEYNYTRRASRSELLSFTVGWLLAVGTVIAASTVALGFGGYFSAVFGVEQKIAAAGLLIVMGALNYIGIRESARFNNFSSILEALGLVVVVVAVLLLSPNFEVDLLEMPAEGFPGIITAVSVIFFAYIGFENVANLAEEVKDSRRIVPKALLLSLVISTILYVLVAIAAVMEVDPAVLAQSEAPITLVVSRTLGPYATVLSFIALFATANTVLIFLIASSRMLYGMSKGGSLPGIFSKVGVRRTPYFSVAITTAFALLGVLLWDIATVAKLTDLAVFIAYFAVNVALIALVSSAHDRTFMSPRLFGLPVFAYLGAIAAFLMLFSFDPFLWILEGMLIAVGIAIFLVNKRRRR